MRLSKTYSGIQFFAPAIGITTIYDKDGTLVYRASCAGGDGNCTVTLQKNIVTVVYTAQNDTVVIREVETNTKNISITSDSSVYTTNITLPYSPIKITFTSGGGDTPITVLQGETKDATLENGAVSTGAGITLYYYEELTPKVTVDLTSLSGYESLAAGTYALSVKAKAQGYQDSDLSSTVSFTKLAAPVITATDTTVTWEAITNAESYDVYVDGELYENTTGGGGNV